MPRKKKEKGFFAERLNELRVKAGLTQEELAEAAGLGKSTVQQFEQGWRQPTFDTLVKLAHGLGVSLAEFNQVPPARKPRKGK